MALARVKTWNPGDTLTAADLNAEFNNILNNAISLISPLTGTLNVNNQQLTNLVLEKLAASPVAATAGRLYYQTTKAQVEVDTGTAIKVCATTLTDELTGLGTAYVSGTSASVAVGACASDDATIANRILMSLTASITGTTAGTWVVGTNQPKLDAGAIAASTWYHVFVIERPDTGVVDVLFSTSATAPALPTNYTKQRRISSFKTDGASNLLNFVQDADFFQWVSPVLDVDATNPGAAAVTRTLTVPTGVNVRAVLNVAAIGTSGGATPHFYLSDLGVTDQAPSATVAPLFSLIQGSAANPQANQQIVRTNTSAQIRSRTDASDGGVTLRIATVGWYDRRGRG